MDKRSFEQEMEWFRQLQWTQRLAIFHNLNEYAKKGQIVFTGSSLMEQFPLLELSQGLNLPCHLYNRGIGGFVTAQLLEHLDVCVYELEPSHIFINIGTNDMNGPEYSQDGLVSRYEDILTSIQSKLPKAMIHVLAYYPVNPDARVVTEQFKETFRHRSNQAIISANKRIEALADKMGARFHNLNQGLTDDKGRLKEAYTMDGMHMYANGYKKVFENLLPILRGL